MYKGKVYRNWLSNILIMPNHPIEKPRVFFITVGARFEEAQFGKSRFDMFDKGKIFLFEAFPCRRIYSTVEMH